MVSVKERQRREARQGIRHVSMRCSRHATAQHCQAERAVRRDEQAEYRQMEL